MDYMLQSYRWLTISGTTTTTLDLANDADGLPVKLAQSGHSSSSPTEDTNASPATPTSSLSTSLELETQPILIGGQNNNNNKEDNQNNDNKESADHHQQHQKQAASRRLLAGRLSKLAKLGGRHSRQLIESLRQALYMDELDYSRFRALRLIRPTSELNGRFTCSVSSLDGDDLRSTKLVVYGK